MKHSVDYYAELKKLVNKEDISITCVIGPPRTGTTAIEKYIYEKFSYTTQVNHPGLGNNEKNASWKEIYDSAIDAIKQHGTPAHIVSYMVVKNTSHYILPEELKKWEGVCKGFVVCVRNPLLQVESLIGLIADKIAVEGVGGIAHLDNASHATHHGKKLLKKNTSKESWKEWAETVKSRRDLRSIGLAFRSCMIEEHEYQDPHFLTSLFREYATKHCIGGELQTTQEMPDANKYAQCDYKKFYTLPDLFQDALLEWRLGWTSTKAYVENFTSNKIPFIMLDFSCFQTNPEEYLPQLTDFLIKNHCISATPATYKKIFNIGADNSHYKAIAFSTAIANSSILHPYKAPLTIADFPDFLHPMLESAFSIYSELCQQLQMIKPSNEVIEYLATIDPITARCASSSSTSDVGTIPGGHFTRGYMKELKMCSAGMQKS